MRESKLIINGQQVVYDLSPLIDLALATGDKAWFRELYYRNRLVWKYDKTRKGLINGNYKGIIR
ncbi:IDEAL domain-containing protein [Bacillus marasmi]|uniref:IDEAL domain-containing protein n=1 Tax=Bacillus marasmi TaxID=1926279 RepID=UPI0011C7DF49|nr:IDEAL domain-containing protein [Bacillus marasmi]